MRSIIRRSREFGTYILIGLENKQVARLFFLENLVVGSCALLLGILLGNLIFQVLRAIVLALFGNPYHFAFSFSPRAVGLTLFYFILIYLFAQLKSRKRIRSMKIYDLIYFERQNESAIIKKSSRQRIIFVVSIALGIIGTFLIMVGRLLFGIIGSGCIITFLYGFFSSFSSGVPAWFEKHSEKKYQRQNLLVFRTLSAKLATMGVVMATIALLFTATLISEGSGIIFRSIFQNRAKQMFCFDLFFSSEKFETENFSNYISYINANISVKVSRQYNIYLRENSEITDYIEANTKYFPYYSKDTLMRFSDYAALREMLGYPPVILEPEQYLIHCQRYVLETLKDWHRPITIGEHTLTFAGIQTEIFAQESWDTNGAGFLLIVPDEAAEVCLVNHSIYAAKTKEPISEAQFNILEDKLDNIIINENYFDHFLFVKSAQEAELASMTAMVVFPLYYLALVLIMVAATILTIQQLSEMNHYRRQFELLRKLGMNRKEMIKVLRTQFVIYYTMPAIPPLLIGVPFILNLGGGVEPGIMIGASHPLVIVGITLGLFFLIYAIYILLAYTSLKRSVLPV